jgi:hypothetical protein
MTRSLALNVYIAALRLYPARFRAEFGDEMAETLASALRDASDAGPWSLAALLLSELRDFPGCLLREHIRERRKTWLVSGEVTMLSRLYSPRLVRFSAVTMLLMFALCFTALVGSVVAFDIDNHSLANAFTWYGQYDWDPAFIGNQIPVGLMVLILWLLAPPWMVVFGSALMLNVTTRWSALLPRQRALALLAIVAGVVTLAGMASPAGSVGALWFYD